MRESSPSFRSKQEVLEGCIPFGESKVGYTTRGKEKVRWDWVNLLKEQNALEENETWRKCAG